MAIYSIKTNASEGSHDIGIVVEGIRVLTSQGTIPRACCMLIGIAYAVNLAYPKQLNYTFEAFQKLFLELDCSKLSPKLNSLKNKLLAWEQWLCLHQKWHMVTFGVLLHVWEVCSCLFKDALLKDTAWFVYGLTGLLKVPSCFQIGICTSNIYCTFSSIVIQDVNKRF